MHKVPSWWLKSRFNCCSFSFTWNKNSSLSSLTQLLIPLQLLGAHIYSFLKFIWKLKILVRERSLTRNMIQYKITENRPNWKPQNRKQLEGRICPVQVCEHTSTAQVLSACAFNLNFQVFSFPCAFSPALTYRSESHLLGANWNLEESWNFQQIFLWVVGLPPHHTY